MTRTLTIAILALFLAASTSCRGHRGDEGATGQNGVDGVDGTNGVDGKSGTDLTSGYTFDYSRGIHGVDIVQGILVIKADLVVPKTILDLAPASNTTPSTSPKLSVNDGVQLALGSSAANLRYFLVPVDAGKIDVCTKFVGQQTEHWVLDSAAAGYLAIIPMDSVTALTLDPAVIGQGALIDFPNGESRRLSLFDDEVWLGQDVQIYLKGYTPK